MEHGVGGVVAVDEVTVANNLVRSENRVSSSVAAFCSSASSGSVRQAVVKLARDLDTAAYSSF